MRAGDQACWQQGLGVGSGEAGTDFPGTLAKDRGGALGRKLHFRTSRDLELLTPSQCPTPSCTLSSWTLLARPLCSSLSRGECACVWGVPKGGRTLHGCDLYTVPALETFLS